MDYFPFDVDFFDDEKIAAISGEFGIKGEIAAIKLLCAVYRNGYFLEWNERLQMKLLRELPGVSVDLLSQIVGRLVRWGFFDEHLFNSSAVLTSRGIQKRYFAIAYRRIADANLPYVIVSRNGVGDNRIGVSDSRNGVSDSRNSVSAGFLPAERGESKGNKIKKSSSDDEDEKSPPPPPPETGGSKNQKNPLAGKVPENDAKSSAVGVKNAVPVENTNTEEITPLNAQNAIFQKKLPFDENASECIGDVAWQESVCISLGLKTMPEWGGLFSAFRAHLVSTGQETEKTRRDFKEHFVSWLRIKLLNQKKENGRQEKMGGYDRNGSRQGISRTEIAPAAVVSATRGKSVI